MTPLWWTFISLFRCINKYIFQCKYFKLTIFILFLFQVYYSYTTQRCLINYPNVSIPNKLNCVRYNLYSLNYTYKIKASHSSRGLRQTRVFILTFTIIYRSVRYNCNFYTIDGRSVWTIILSSRLTFHRLIEWH